MKYLLLILCSMPLLALSEGYEHFKQVKFKLHEQEFVRLIEEGQTPKFLFIGCSDSRVVPQLITSTNPGDLFVIRNAGNFVPPFNSKEIGTKATIQYAIEVLGVKDIIICGHSDCGAIAALFVESNKKLNLVNEWIKLGNEAKEIALKQFPSTLSKEQMVTETTKLSVVLQLERILGYPFVKELVQEEKLFLHGWYYTIETGKISYYDPNQAKFLSLL